MLNGLAVFRSVAWIWMVSVVVVLADDLDRPWIAALAVGASFAVTVSFAILVRNEPHRLLRPWAVAAELGCGLSIVVVDGWAYTHGHVFGSSQTLGVIWPLIGVLSAGLVGGPLWGALAGAAFAPARVLGAVANGVGMGGHRVLSVVSTAMVYATCGAVVGYIMRLLKRAEHEVAAAKASEEVARTLHDGVLQTLAVIERRTGEPAIARMAREQERELRRYLFDGTQTTTGAPSLREALDGAVARFEANFSGKAEVLIVDDLPVLSDAKADAIAGAVGEALTNAGKHGRAHHVTIYLEPTDDGGVFCSVKDDGSGFDAATFQEGVGVARSIRGRLAEVGARAELRSTPGDGAEVCMWVP
jgi:signal transduction histidine kinase